MSQGPNSAPNIDALPNQRPYWLTDAIVPLETDQSIVEPASIGISDGTVPAVFEIGEQSFALVKQTTQGGADTFRLQGLRPDKTGRLRPVRKTGIELGNTTEGPVSVEIGNQTGMISREQLAGSGLAKAVKLRIGRRKQSPRFEEVGDESSLRITINDGKVAVQDTTYERTGKERRSVRMIGKQRRAEVAPPAPARTEEPPEVDIAVIRADYEQRAAVAAARAERQRLADERRARAEREHTERVFAPKDNVPDLTAGDIKPVGYQGSVVTESSRDFAREWVRTALMYDRGGGFRDALAPYFDQYITSGNIKQIDGVIDAVRNNNKLRQSLGNRFMDKIEDAIYQMGDNVRRPNKTPNFPGYRERMSGREYAAVLALSHLDGTFDPAREAAIIDASDLNEDGWPMLDQHRAAARYAIDGLKWQDRIDRQRRTP